MKMEPEVKDKEEKQAEQHHSDNDSSATCSADEDVEAEPDRQGEKPLLLFCYGVFIHTALLVSNRIDSLLIY